MLELIDIWHFGLSIELMSGDSYDQIAERMLESLDLTESVRGDLKLDVERFAEATLKTRLFDVKAFCTLLVDVDLSFDDLYSSYVGKNVLNFFRQDNGYKEGTYIKVWGGQEDNEHLVEAIKALDANHSDFKELLYKELSRRYGQYSAS